MEPLSDFVVSTHAELLRISAEIARARATMPKHRPCPDEGPCRFCEKIRSLHAQADDHLAQLRGEPAEPTPVRNALLASYAAENWDDRTADPICRCGRSKFLLHGDVLACCDCDCPPLPHLGLGKP